MAQKKVYDNEFKIQAVKLGREIGFSKAAELVKSSINKDTVNLSRTVPNIDEACPIIKNTKFRFNVFFAKPIY